MFDFVSPSSENLAGLAATIYRSRRIRHEIFDNPIFINPAWDLLLDIYARNGRGENVSVGSACNAALVPAPTALRYLNALAECGYIRRTALLHDAISPIVTMTSVGSGLMDRWLLSLATSTDRQS
jgi:DNA-binding MarR family transcriptional regulator